MTLPVLGFAQERMAQIEDTKLLLAQNPDNVDQRVSLAELQYLEGIEYFNAGDEEQADALFRESLATLEESSEIPEDHQAYRSARYALAYLMWRQGRHVEAVRELDRMLNYAPEHLPGRYLLGVSLNDSRDPELLERSFEVFLNLATDPQVERFPVARDAAVRYVYNWSTLYYANDNAEKAFGLAFRLQDRVLPDLDRESEAYQKSLFAVGVYRGSIDDATDAAADLEALYYINPSFSLANGIQIREVLSNAYYRAGLEQLAQDDEEGGRQALIFFRKVQELEGESRPDVIHGIALGEKVSGNETGYNDAMASLLEVDADYYERITGQ